MAADYTSSLFDKQAATPAPTAPEGLKQEAARHGGPDFQTSIFAPRGDYTQDMKSWFGGRNMEGTNSGWNNERTAAMFDSYDSWLETVAESRRSKDPAKWKDFYGWLDPKQNPSAASKDLMAFWDDPQGRFKRGDIVRNGQAQVGQNIYEVFGDETADMMMAPFMFSAGEQKRFNRDSNPAARYAREVKDAADAWSEDAKHAESALAYQRDVYREKMDILEGHGEEAGFFLGGAGGAAALASPLLAFGPLGWAAWGLATVAGGTAALLNQDQLAEQLARGRVQADRASQKYGSATSFTANLTEWGGVAQRFLSPFSNATQGVYDAFEGDVGDGESSFYGVNERGERLAPGWLQGADLLASFADSTLQFISPAGRLGYTATMGGVVTGKVGTALTTSWGEDQMAGFNVRTGQWDEFEGSQWVYALGAIGIDALQMGVGAQIGRAANSAKSAYGVESRFGQLPKWLGGGERPAAKLGREPHIEHGRKYTFDETGTAVKKRATATVIVPSEFVSWATVGALARINARKRSALTASHTGRDLNPAPMKPGAMDANTANRWVDRNIKDRVNRVAGTHMPTPDDYYRASLQLMTSSPFRTALLNGFAEGWEEGIQAILEPASFGESIDPAEVGRAYLYGLASGAGMGLGARSVSPEAKQEARAKSLYMIRERIDDIGKEEWKAIYYGPGVTDEMRRTMAIADVDEQRQVNELLKGFDKIHRFEMSQSVLSINAINGMRAKKWEQLYKSLNPKIEGSRVIMGMANRLVGINGAIDKTKYAINAAVESFDQVVQDLRMIAKGLDVQVASAKKQVEQWEARSTDAKLTDDQRTEAAQKRDRSQAELDMLPLAQAVARQVFDNVAKELELYRAATKPTDKQDIADRVNVYLQEAAKGSTKFKDRDGNVIPEDVTRRAVELKLVRNPMIDSGPLLLHLQVSTLLTDLGMHATTYMQQAHLKTIGGDHDGDTAVAVNSLFIPGDEMKQLQRGAHYIQSVGEKENIWQLDDKGQRVMVDDGTGNMVPVPIPGKEYMARKVTVVMDQPDGSGTRINIAADALAEDVNSLRRKIVQDELKDLEKLFITRYVDWHGVFTQAELQEHLDKYTADIMAKDHDAEQTLLDGLFNAKLSDLLLLADTTKSGGEMLWMQSALIDTADNIQRGLAANAAAHQKKVSSGAPQTLPEEVRFGSEVSVIDAVSDGMTLEVLLEYMTDPTRQAQGLHFSPFFTSAVIAAKELREGASNEESLRRLIAEFENVGAGQTEAEIDAARDPNPIETRVIRELESAIGQIRAANPGDPRLQNAMDVMTIMTAIPVPSVVATGVNEFKVGEGNTTLLQVLLAKSIRIEERRKPDARQDDPIMKRIKKLKPLTRPEAPHSYTAHRAFMAVFGDTPMYNLAGDESDAVGGRTTPNQLVKYLMPLGTTGQTQTKGEWRSYTSYLDNGHGDPPHSTEMFATGQVNAFTLVMDAVMAEANARQDAMRKADGLASEHFEAFHKNLRSLLTQWAQGQHARLIESAKANGVPTDMATDEDKKLFDQFVFTDFLERNPSYATVLNEVVPEAALMGIYRIKDGKLWAAPWLVETFLDRDTKRAEKNLFVNSKFAEIRYLDGQRRWDLDIEEKRAEERRQGVAEDKLTARVEVGEDGRPGGLDPRLIKSRFVEMVYSISSDDPFGFQRARLFKVMDEAPSLPALMKAINEDPLFVGDKAPLLAYHDSVALFEEDPSDVWSTGDTAGQQQREGLQKAADRFSRMSAAYAKARSKAKEEDVLLDKMEKHVASGAVGGEASYWVDLLRKALIIAQKFPDRRGPAAMDQFMAMVQQGLPRVQDKGKPDARAEGMGTIRITAGSRSGYVDGYHQQMDALTQHSWEGVMQNLSGIAQTPTRVMLNDGRVVTIDFSNELAVIQMLRNPVTRAFAKAVLFPTVRDVDINNVTQHYALVSTGQQGSVDSPLAQMLKDAALGHLFPEEIGGVAPHKGAYQFLSMIESSLELTARTLGEADRAHQTDIIQRGMDEFLIAYMHGPDAEDRNEEAERIALRRNFGTVLMNSTLVHKDNLPWVREIIEETLKKRFLESETLWSKMGLDEDQAKVLDTVLSTHALFAWRQRKKMLTDKRDKETDPVKKQMWADELKRVNKDMATFLGSPTLAKRLKVLPTSVTAALAQFTVHLNDTSNPTLMADSRLNLLNYLTNGNKINGLTDPKLYHLQEDVLTFLHDDPNDLLNSDRISPEEWMQLGAAAATIAINESAAHAESGVGFRPLQLGEDAEKFNRVYDRSWSFLLDPIFDKAVQQHARIVAKDLGGYTSQTFDMMQLAGQIEDLLFPQHKMGPWTQLVVSETERANKALGGSTVTGAIQRPGMSVAEDRDAIGVGWNTFTMPDQVDYNKHHTTFDFVIDHRFDDPGTLVGSLGAIDPSMYMKLEHHFVDSVKVYRPDGSEITVTLPDGTVRNFFDLSTEQYVKETSVRNSKYRYFRGDWFQKHLMDAQRQSGEGGYRVEISLVDVDKKPHTVEYVNSILFDGVGSAGTAGTGPGTIAETIYRIGGESKQGQQGPLDYAAKAGKVFWQILTADLSLVKTMENKTQPLAKILYAKAQALWNTEFETGFHTLGDNNTAYKLMKMRHVVRGKEPGKPDGPWIYRWSEDIIQKETTGFDLKTVFENGEYELIPLSLPVMQTLLGRSGMQGTDALTMPLLNIRDAYTFPSLDAQRLLELGLEDLGDDADLDNSSFASIVDLPVLSYNLEGRGAEITHDIRAGFEQWNGELLEVHGNRGSLPALKINTKTGSKAANRDLMRAKTYDQMLVSILSELGLSYDEMQDLSNIRFADNLEKTAENIMKNRPNAMIWVARQSETVGNAALGILGRADMENNYRDVQFGGKKVHPVYGDIVVIDLDDLRQTLDNGRKLNHDEAIDEALKIYRALAKRGVTIVLGASAEHKLRADVAAEIRKGGENYQGVEGNSHWFEPSSVYRQQSRNIMSLESTEVATSLLDPALYSYWFASDFFGIGATENAWMLDYQYMDQSNFGRITNVLIPSDLMSMDRDGVTVLWNLPQNGEGVFDDWGKLRAVLPRMLKEPEYIKHLKLQAGGVGGNPKDMPLMELDADGKWTYGVLDFDAAIKRLIDNLEAKIDPLTETLLPGDFYPIMSSSGDITLLRYGFKYPSTMEINRMLRASKGQTVTTPGGDMVNVAIAPAQLHEAQTIVPPSIVRHLHKSIGYGLVMEVEPNVAVMGKGMLQGPGFKAGFTGMPANLTGPVEPLSPIPGNNLHITGYGPKKPIRSKQAVMGSLINFQEMFILTGFDFQKDMVEFLFGPPPWGSKTFDEIWGEAQLVLNAWANHDWSAFTRKDLNVILDNGSVWRMVNDTLNTYGNQLLGPGWTTQEFVKPPSTAGENVTNRIALSLLVTMMLPDIKLEHIIGSRGMLTVENRFSGSKVRELPSFLTEALHNPYYKATREEMVRRANATANWPTMSIPTLDENGNAVRDQNGAIVYHDVPVYQLDPDFTFKVRMFDPETKRWFLVPGNLMRVKMLPFSKDSASLSISQLSMKSNVSPHIATVTSETIGAWTAADPGKGLPNALEELFGDNNIQHFTDDEHFHHIFARMHKMSARYSPWQRRFPVQEKYRDHARRRYILYNKPVDKTGDEWRADKEWQGMIHEFLRVLHLDPDRDEYEVDRLVRQRLGRPGAAEEGEADVITPKQYRQALHTMILLVKDHTHPLHGGAVPQEAEAFWAKVYRAQRGEEKPWAPAATDGWVRGKRQKKEFPDDWDGWVRTLFGQVRASNADFHTLYRTDTDAFMHTFQGTTPAYISMPLSFDTQRDLMLIDPQYNRYVVSMDPMTNALYSSPIIMDSMTFNMETLTGNNKDLFNPLDMQTTPASSVAENIDRAERWLAGQRMAKQKKTSVRKYYADGAAYIDSASNTHNFFMGLNHLQLMMRLANPGLYTSALLEVPFKNMLQQLTDIASGDAGGATGQTITWLTEKLRAGNIGIKTQYTGKQLKLLKEVAAFQGRSTEYRGELFDYLVYKDLPHNAQPNKLGRLLERGAGAVSRVTGDPRLGMTAKSAAYRANLAALEYLRSIDSSITVEQFAALSMQNPTWLKDFSSDERVSAWSVGMNRVAKTRGTRQSAINKSMFGWIDKLETSDYWITQAFGFMLNVPFRFKRFNIGTFLTLTGMDGFDQLFAMMKDQRPKHTFLGRLQAAMRNEPYEPDEFQDFTDVIEGLDLARPFVQGGITQTMLLAGGLFAGKLSLDGEDDESKKRRRMMEHLDGVYLYDPRKAENDFLYADAMFLDSIPWVNTLFEDPNTGRSAIVPHWVFRQFTSPLMGIQRFFNTGDMREIAWGFQDAIGAVPTSVLNTWNQSVEAVHQLNVEAQDYARESNQTLETQSTFTQLVINTAAIFESALLENNFVNSVRSGADRYDRDPYRLPATDESGNIVMEDGLPKQTETLVDYREPDTIDPVTGEVIPGEVKQAYEKRPDTGIRGARSHAYAENHLVYSLLASLFTGQIRPGESSFGRNQMMVKERKLEVPTATRAEAEAFILGSFMKSGGAQNLTLEEIIHIRKDYYEAQNITWNQADIEEEAAAIYKAHSGPGGGMSLLDDEGREVIAKDGAHGIYKGLWHGTLTFDDAVLEGLVIPWPMRDEIASEWIAQLIQEGVDKGMSQEGARYYAKRVWYGDNMNPVSVGLKDILYDDRIPGDGTVKYNQLNMMYMIGPDGRPWATPFERQKVLQSFGIPLPHRLPANPPGLSKDEGRGTVVDDILGINTGLYGLERKPNEPYEPPEDLFDKAAGKEYTPGSYLRRPYSRGGGGGGGGYFTRMEPFPRGVSPDLNGIPMINTTNPYIRRANVNRQRITSERERLKQWQ